MEKRKFGIPAIALGFTALTLTGCPVDDDKDDEEDEEDGDEDTDDGGDSAGIDGSWSLDSYSYYGESYPLDNTYEYNGYTYSSSIAGVLVVASPSANFTLTSSYYTDHPSYSADNGDDVTEFSGSVTDNGGTYGIDFTDWISMECTQSGDSLDCAGTGDYSDLGLGFVR